MASVITLQALHGLDGRLRIAQKVAQDRIISTVDPDARHALHRHQDGFKSPHRDRTRYRDHHRLRADQSQWFG